ncbi:hypothetical protein K491DRAFT_717260 [Lophiostoma macrostomum CBS 122681]|uniref:Uncharacterized protein n=1 Tax=Lophiostoma macrostomum CBS 122681 TaxID=1314788 RepID=A0A6A6T2M7_9PLEO|nr:hypothetical protein K491DRAFT_717260 [Lophiostoma macrostomum CBS 122681]
MDIKKRISKRWSCVIVPQSQPSKASTEEIEPTKPVNKRWSTSLSFLRSATSDEPSNDQSRYERDFLSPRRNGASRTFPFGPDSRSLLPEPPVKKAPDIVEAQWENIPLYRRINAATRVAHMRATFIPHSIEYRALADHNRCSDIQEEANKEDMGTDSTTAVDSQQSSPSSNIKISEGEAMLNNRSGTPNELPKLKEDALWISLIYLPTAAVAGSCVACNKDITFPKASSWRLHGCGHRYHLSCFRDLSWLYPTSSTTSTSTDTPTLKATKKTKCFRCENFRRQCCKIGIQNMHSRIDRLENLLCPHKIELHCPSLEGRGRATMEACEREIAEESARSRSYPPPSPWTLDQSPQFFDAPLVLIPASTFKLDAKDMRPESWPPKDTKTTPDPPARPRPSPVQAAYPKQRTKPLYPSPLRITKRVQDDPSARQPPHLTSSPTEDRFMSPSNPRLAPSTTSASSLTVHPSTSLAHAPSPPWHKVRGNETHIPTPVHRAAEPRQADIEKAKQKQKRTWRESVPVGTDIQALENVYRLNPGHAIFRRIEALAEEDEREEEAGEENSRRTSVKGREGWI